MKNLTYEKALEKLEQIVEKGRNDGDHLRNYCPSVP